MSQALHHQQQLEEQEQTESKVRKFTGPFTDSKFETHIHSDDELDVVWLHISTDNVRAAVTLTKEAARQIANDLFDHSR